MASDWRARLAAELRALPAPTPARIRAKRGKISRAIVAEWLGVSYRAYQDWELGTNAMPRAAWELLHVKLSIESLDD